jgi:hypothetical protein
MGYYLLEYALIDDYLTRRAAFREAHLALAREAHGRGDLILAGALPRLIERFSFGGQTIAPLLNASSTAILTFAMAWSPHGPSGPGPSSSARDLDRADAWPLVSRFAIRVSVTLDASQRAFSPTWMTGPAPKTGKASTAARPPGRDPSLA